jgi:redox-sensitive bicupin YhaK (pirin superfamily)
VSRRVGGRAIELVLRPSDKDLGGFSVRRLLPTAQRRMVGPWIFFDHMGPADFPAGAGINVRPHPHINLMVAGRGIVHSERERPEITAVPHRLHGLQLRLALPEADKEIEPAVHHYPAASSRPRHPPASR